MRRITTGPPTTHPTFPIKLKTHTANFIYVMDVRMVLEMNVCVYVCGSVFVCCASNRADRRAIREREFICT